MKCMKCNNHEANVYISTNINGKVKKEYLCTECAKDINMKEFMNMEKMLTRMFNTRHSLGMHDMLLDSGINNMFENDYIFNNMFNDINNIEQILKPTNRVKCVKISKPKIKQDQDVESTVRIKKENAIDNKEDNIQVLQYKLQKAIDEERYEDAAVIRDKINNIKK